MKKFFFGKNPISDDWLYAFKNVLKVNRWDELFFDADEVEKTGLNNLLLENVNSTEFAKELFEYCKVVDYLKIYLYSPYLGVKTSFDELYNDLFKLKEFFQNESKNNKSS